MRSSTLLRVSVVLEWVFIGLVLLLSSFFERKLPDPLRSWLAADAESELTLQEILVLGVSIPFLLCALVGSIGLLLLKRWGAWVYLSSVIIGFALLPFTGPTVEHAWADAIDETSVLLSGLIIGIAFYSDALRLQTANNAEQADAGNRRSAGA